MVGVHPACSAEGSSVEATGQHCFYLTLCPTLFANFRLPLTLIRNIMSSAEIMIMNRWLVKNEEKHNGEHHLLQLFLLCFLFVKQLLDFITMKNS